MMRILVCFREEQADMDVTHLTDEQAGTIHAELTRFNVGWAKVVDPDSGDVITVNRAAIAYVVLARETRRPGR